MAFLLPQDLGALGGSGNGSSGDYRAAVKRAFDALGPFETPSAVPSVADAFRGAVVLVAGAGPAARALWAKLLALDVAELHVLAPADAALDGLPSDPRAKVHRFNVHSQITRLDGLPPDVDFAVNAHERAADWARDADFLEDNADVARAVFRLASGWRDRGRLRRLVHLSSGEVYGYRVNPPTEGVLPHDVGIPYAYSKTIAELAAAKFMELKLPLTVLRLGAVYGPGGGEVAECARRIRRGWAFVIDGGTKNPGLLHADDAADAVLLAAAAPHAEGQVYNVCGDDTELTWKDLYSTVAKGIGEEPPTLPLPGFLVYYLVWIFEMLYRMMGWYAEAPWLTSRRMHRELVDGDIPSNRAKRELGFQPKVGWRNGVKDSLDSLKERGGSKSGDSKKDK
ncbi:hypothetical protein DFJ74DRAFT_708153 [Hyaloraphidium curvatum]|nr:hypothetical protein DFJ74DRAFT_708153 [Hyaloraphidium curvatum]